MTDTTFSISANNRDYCFKPLVCATNQGHLVVWAFGVDSETNLFARAYKSLGEFHNLVDTAPTAATQVAVKIDTLADTDHILFLRPYTKDTYVLAVETIKGTTIYILDADAQVLNTQYYNESDVVIHCHPAGDRTVLFTYTHSINTLYIGSVPFTDWNSDYKVNSIYNDVYEIPQVFISGDHFTAGWLGKDWTLRVINGGIYDKQVQTTSITSYDVDYLMATAVDDHVVVYGGYNNKLQTLRLDFFDKDDGVHLCSRYWKSAEYSDLYFNMVSVNNGFMLLADGPHEEAIYGQRFTHLGSWLYPIRKLTEHSESTWSPDLSRSKDHTLLVYIRDYDDHSEVWGKWMNVGEIPELYNITLSDLEG